MVTTMSMVCILLTSVILMVHQTSGQMGEAMVPQPMNSQNQFRPDSNVPEPWGNYPSNWGKGTENRKEGHIPDQQIKDDVHGKRLPPSSNFPGDQMPQSNNLPNEAVAVSKNFPYGAVPPNNQFQSATVPPDNNFPGAAVAPNNNFPREQVPPSNNFPNEAVAPHNNAEMAPKNNFFNQPMIPNENMPNAGVETHNNYPNPEVAQNTNFPNNPVAQSNNFPNVPLSPSNNFQNEEVVQNSNNPSEEMAQRDIERNLPNDQNKLGGQHTQQFMNYPIPQDQLNAQFQIESARQGVNSLRGQSTLGGNFPGRTNEDAKNFYANRELLRTSSVKPPFNNPVPLADTYGNSLNKQSIQGNLDAAAAGGNIQPGHITQLQVNFPMGGQAPVTPNHNLGRRRTSQVLQPGGLQTDQGHPNLQKTTPPMDGQQGNNNIKGPQSLTPRQDSLHPNPKPSLLSPIGIKSSKFFEKYPLTSPLMGQNLGQPKVTKPPQPQNAGQPQGGGLQIRSTTFAPLTPFRCNATIHKEPMYLRRDSVAKAPIQDQFLKCECYETRAEVLNLKKVLAPLMSKFPPENLERVLPGDSLCQVLPEVTKLKSPGEFVVVDPELRIFAYSAYFDLRLKPTLRILVIAPFKGVPLFIQYVCSEEQHVSRTIRAHVEFIAVAEQADGNCAWNQFFVVAEMPAKCTPERLSLTRTPCGTPHGVLPVTTVGFIQMDVPIKSAVCTSILYDFNDEDVGHLAEFVELYMMYGVEKIYIYDTYNVSSVFESLVEYYEKQGIIVRIPWKVPEEVSFMYYFGQILQFIDCVYKTMDTVRYLGIFDLDDIFIPSDKKTWEDLFQKYRDSFPGGQDEIASIYFPWTVVCDNNFTKSSSEAEALLSKGTSNGKPKVATYFSPNHVLGGIRHEIKQVVIPRRVFRIHVHGIHYAYPGYRAIKAMSTDHGVVYHYRKNSLLCSKYRPYHRIHVCNKLPELHLRTAESLLAAGVIQVPEFIKDRPLSDQMIIKNIRAKKLVNVAQTTSFTKFFAKTTDMNTPRPKQKRYNCTYSIQGVTFNTLCGKPLQTVKANFWQKKLQERDVLLLLLLFLSLLVYLLIRRCRKTICRPLRNIC